MRGFTVGVALAMGCGPDRVGAPSADDAGERLLPPGDAELVFAADFTETVSGPLVAGTSVRLTFDEARLTRCRGWKYGLPAWAITVFYRIDGGDVRSVPVVMPSGIDEVWIDLDQPGELELWFSNNDAFGCIAWDSDFGANYRFEVLPDGPIPAWMGNASSVVSRQTCGGTFCEGELRPLDQGFLFDTWARQRALVAEATFQAWAPGVTDAARDEVWALLDARIHWSTTPDLAEAGWDWVNVHDFPGNDVRYAYRLRDLDPLGGSTVIDPEDCPDVPLRLTADGMYVEADLWVWFSVNGALLQPAEGAWRGTFQDYAGLYAPCL
jgi:hypothetical protein